MGNDRWSITLATDHRAGVALRQEQIAPPWLATYLSFAAELQRSDAQLRQRKGRFG